MPSSHNISTTSSTAASSYVYRPSVSEVFPAGHEEEDDLDLEAGGMEQRDKERTTRQDAHDTTSRRCSSMPDDSVCRTETQAVSYLRWVLLAVLVSSMIAAASGVYQYDTQVEHDAFVARYLGDATKLVEAISGTFYSSLGAVDSYVVGAVSFARFTHQEWPYVTIPDYAVRMAKLRSLSKAVVTQQAHFVTGEERSTWENYTLNHDQWAQESLQIQQHDKNYKGVKRFNYTTFVPDGVIHSYMGPSEGDGPFLPTWQSAPVVPVFSAYNWDALAYTSVSDAMPELLGPKSAVISKVSNMADESNPISIAESNAAVDYIKDFIDPSEDPTEPFSVINFPILDTAADTVVNYNHLDLDNHDNRTMVGLFTMMFFWHDLIKNQLPSGSNGTVIVLDNGGCNQSFTYQINGPDVVYLGRGDHHDAQYDYLVQQVRFQDLAQLSSIGKAYTGLPLSHGGEERSCSYRLRIYPSATLEALHTTHNPIIFTICSVFIFVFTSGIFLTYDMCVERRQRKVMHTAKQSTETAQILEGMVAERTRTLVQTNLRLEHANQRATRASAAQLEHFACMSHEIRTPLNCIIGLSSLLLEEAERSEEVRQKKEQLKLANTSTDAEETPKIIHNSLVMAQAEAEAEALTEHTLSQMQQESIRMMVSSGDLLLTVVNDVLDYSKLESGNLEIEIRRSNLQETLNTIVHSLETKARPKQLAIRTTYDPAISEYVHMDCRRLQQVLYNLLGNAVKFSKTGGIIDLTVSLQDTNGHESNRQQQSQGGAHGCQKSADISASSESEEVYRTDNLVIRKTPPRNALGMMDDSSKASHFRLSSVPPPGSMREVLKQATKESLSRTHNGKMICFAVRDSGQGIDPTDFHKIFQPFRQASAETERVYGGTGLGLAVTAKIVSSLGGHISVSSEVGEWTEFRVELPFRDVPVNTEALAQKLQNATILLVGNINTNVDDTSRVFRSCNLNFEKFAGMRELVMATINTPGYLNKDRSYICMVHESLYDHESFAALAKAARSVLLTYGPKYAVKETKGHYRSLTQMLPSVLMASLCSVERSLLSEESLPGTPKAAAGASTVAKKSFENLQLLIAEDNKINQKVLIRILKRLGLENVDVVDDGKQAVEAEAQKAYDCILMDVQMPVMDGIEACREIMKRKGGGHIQPKVIFVTAHVSDAFETECRAAGGTDFLPKPFNIADIDNCLKRKVEMAEETMKS